MSIPGWPGGPQQPPPAPPPKRRRTLAVILTVVGVVAVLCCGGAVVGGVFLFKDVSRATGPVNDAADTFVTDLENGDTTGAYGLLCGTTRAAFTPDAFARGVTGQARIVSHQLARINVSSGSHGSTAVVTMKLTMQNGFVDEHALPLVKEDGHWKVCGGPY